jgi:hypothetical protein
MARRECERNSWPWKEPVRVSRRLLGGYEVMTNASAIGGNVFVRISRRGEVTGSGFARR